MNRALAWMVVTVAVGALATPSAARSQAKQEPAKPMELKLKVGDTAPDFTLLAYNGQKVSAISLHDFKGKKNVALAFYVFAFTGG